MRTLLKWVGGLIALLVLLAVSLGVLSELGEVVVLETRTPDGATHHTRLWIVEDGGHAWLRAGQAHSGWLGNLAQQPEISLERGGQTQRFRAVVVDEPAVRDRIHQLMAEKYGLADRLIGVIRDYPAAKAIRLDPY